MKKNGTIHVPVDIDMERELREISRTDERSVAGTVRIAIKEYLLKRRNGKKFRVDAFPDLD